ncbi:hypothetical protein HYX13_04835 [Candidatus Woesearchaeota archaeon]|nr:hypothetical protein [Candidatus Woesearchaeota archaeon]
MEPQEVLTQLKNTSLFTEWKKENKQSFLSHFFSPIDFMNIPQQEPAWEIGFLNSQKKKVTVFFQNDTDGEFSHRAPENVFQEKDDIIEELIFHNVKISFHQAIEAFTSHLKQEFPAVAVKQGFVILQSLQGNTLWNISGITSTFSVINLKLHAKTGKVLNLQQIEVVRKEKGDGKERKEGKKSS